MPAFLVEEIVEDEPHDRFLCFSASAKAASRAAREVPPPAATSDQYTRSSRFERPVVLFQWLEVLRGDERHVPDPHLLRPIHRLVRRSERSPSGRKWVLL